MSKDRSVETWYANARPWVLRRSDIGLHGAPTDHGLRPYWLFFACLRLSPTYDLARAGRHGAPSDPQTMAATMYRLTNPDDFELVLDTYDLFGDVREIFFAVWWRERGSRLFGNPSEFNWTQKPRASLGAMDAGKIREVERCVRSLTAEAAKQAGAFKPANGNDASWRLAAWIDPTSFHARNVANANPITVGKFATNPLPESKGERRLNTRPGVNEDQSRRHLSQTFARDCRTAEAYAENAARGIFPASTPAPSITFDNAAYKVIGERLLAIADWEVAERRRPVAAR